MDGYGIVTNRALKKNDFIINYRGVHKREGDATDVIGGAYVYSYKRPANWVIGATDEASGLGRFINDIDPYHPANCRGRLTRHSNNQCAISLYALQEISPG